MRHVVIMAGGSGTRFWPRSRERTPKQLIRIVGQGTMLQETAGRLKAFCPLADTVVITTKAQVKLTRQQLPSLPPGNIVGEPMGRDTAACVGLAAAIVNRKDPDGVMVVAPADQVIGPADKLVASLAVACNAAAKTGYIVTFGIRPSGPAVVYGYVRRGEKLIEIGGRMVYRAARFHEKPKLDVAEAFVRSGEWYWNSGIFIWTARTIMAALKKHQPALFDAIVRIGESLGTSRAETVIRQEYEKLDRISIDYAVLEKADNVALMEADFEWDDVGSWLALERHLGTDPDGNVVTGKHIGVNTRDCVVVSDTEDDHLVATVGLSDVIVIRTPDATLVCHKAKAAEIKTLVSLLKEKGLTKYL